MPDVDSAKQQNNLGRYYKQFGLEPGAGMREVESAYWRVAGELKGQAAMAPYNEAYEALVSRASHPEPETPVPESAVETPEEEEEDAPVARPASKFGWPSN